MVRGIGGASVDGGVRVHPAAGGCEEAVASTPTGLAGYVQEDLTFAQTSGEIDVDGVGSIGYAYVLTHSGGRDYFNAFGDLVVREGLLGDRTVFQWQDGNAHRLLRVRDNAGVSMRLDWSDEGVTVTSDPRSDGVISSSSAAIDSSGVTSFVDPSGIQSALAYENDLLSRVTHASGAVTEVSYRNVPIKAGLARRVEMSRSVTHDPDKRSPLGRGKASMRETRVGIPATTPRQNCGVRAIRVRVWYAPVRRSHVPGLGIQLIGSHAFAAAGRQR